MLLTINVFTLFCSLGSYNKSNDLPMAYLTDNAERNTRMLFRVIIKIK